MLLTTSADFTRFLPLAALITPLTLTVVLSTRENTTMMHVPTLNFDYLEPYIFSGLGDSTSPLLARLTSAMASNMGVPPIQAIATNITYRHEFVGASLKCEAATEGRLKNMSAIWSQTQSELSISTGGKLMYHAYTLSEPEKESDGYPRLNVTTFVPECVTGDVYDYCYP